MPPLLVRNTGFYFLAGGINQAITLMLWVVLAWWLPPAEIGVFALAIFVIDLLASVSAMGLEHSIMRFYYDNQKSSLLIQSAFLLLFLCLIVTVSLFVVLQSLILKLLPNAVILSQYTWLFALLITTTTLSNVLVIYYNAAKKPFAYTINILIRTSVFFIAALVLVGSGTSILGVFVASTLAMSSATILFLWKERPFTKPSSLSFGISYRMFLYGFPLMLYGILNFLVTYINRIFLDHNTDLASVGIYNFFLMIAMQANAVWSAFNRSWTPEVFSNLADGKDIESTQTAKMAFLITFLYLFVFTVFVAISELFFLKLVFKPIYFDHRSLLYILLVGPLFTGVYTVVHPHIYFSKQTIKILLVSVIVSILYLFSTFFIVKWWGIEGAATSFTGMLTAFALAYVVGFKATSRIPSRVVAWCFLLVTLMAIAIAILLVTSSTIVFWMVILATTILTYWLGNIDEYRKIVHSAIKEKIRSLQ
tara:strand:+ start:5566 stop:6999 length:1434 start_codon:yes stop_codon:yes gene_type:complete